MDKFTQMQIFVAVAEESGFAAAARRLSLSAPAVTRAVAALEAQLGVQLLQRTTRHVRLTEAGQGYLEDCRKILADIQAADEAATGISQEPRGHLSVTAPVLFGQKIVMPGILEYLERYPETTVDAVFYDRLVNLLEEGIDVGIRIGQLPDSRMRARRVGHIRLVCVASPDYIERYGAPEHPDDLRNHHIISSQAGMLSNDWRFCIDQQTTVVKVQPRLTVSNNNAAINAALDGFGITRLLSYQVTEQLESGRFIELLNAYRTALVPVNIIHREGRLTSMKVRAFIDVMAERLKQHPALNPD